MKHYILTVLFVLLSAACAYAAGSQQESMQSGGDARTWLLYRPEALSRDKPVPLVIMMHGGFGSGAQAENSYGWDAASDRHGFVVAYPDGIMRSWNAGGICCGKAEREHHDDVGFINDLIARLVKEQNIDPSRVYLTGMSNGAAMSYRYACEGKYPVAAIGPVSGSLSYECPNPRAVSVMEIHGLEDRNIPFNGSQGSKGVSHVSWLGVPKTLEAFYKADHCTAPAIQQNGVVKTSKANCANGLEVVLITIDDAGHQWPGSKGHSGPIMRMIGIDPPSQSLDATETLWSFFSRH